MRKTTLSHREKELGLEEFTLNLDLLCQNKGERKKFEEKWKKFYFSDKCNPEVFKRNDERLVYLSESWIPTKKDHRLPLLLLFGNPASHSVLARMYFAYEGKRREHRVWRIFKEVSLLDWSSSLPATSGGLFNTNKTIKEKFFNLDYTSPFRIGMAVYFSMPSAPSEPSWSGVGGLYKLFGKKAMKIIENEEQKRIAQIISQFMPNYGGIIAFQKDAYNGVKEDDSPDYSLKSALKGKLKSKCKFNPKINTFGVPSTRFLQGKKAKQILKDIIAKLQT